MKAISVDQVQVSATPGARIDHAIEDAILVAATERRKVELRHNAMVYVVDWEGICKQISSAGVERKK